MFKKYISSVYFLVIVSLVFSSPLLSIKYAAADTVTDSETASIANDIGVNPSPWFGPAPVKTLTTISSGLTEINKQSEILKGRGVSDAAIAAQRTEAIDSLKSYATATNKDETRSFFSSSDRKNVDEGNLKATEGVFKKTLAVGYQKNGMEQGSEWSDLSEQDLTDLDNAIFLCEVCGWWCEISESNESDLGNVCNDCHEDNQ